MQRSVRAARRFASAPCGAADADSVAAVADRAERCARLSRAASRAERRANRRRDAAALRRHLAAGRDRDGFAQESKSRRIGFEHQDRALYDRGSQGRVRRAAPAQAVVELLRPAAAERFRRRARDSWDGIHAGARLARRALSTRRAPATSSSTNPPSSTASAVKPRTA